MKVIVEIAEVYKTPVEVEAPDKATADDCRKLAQTKLEAGETGGDAEYSHTLDLDEWTVRTEQGDYL
jgi:hypothetical protein